jgi:hypothetical protein
MTEEQFHAVIDDDVAWIVGLLCESEAAGLVFLRLVRRLEDFVSSRDRTEGPIEFDLGEVLRGDGCSFVKARPVVTGVAPNHGVIASLGFDLGGYRRCAEAAKNSLVAGGA